MKFPQNIDKNILVMNIVGENSYSHCRLCLKSISDAYIKFEDTVTWHPDSDDGIDLNGEPLSTVLGKLLGEEIMDEISGVDAVCVECVDKVIEFLRFTEQCKNSTNLLHTVFNRLTEAVKDDVNVSNDQILYIIVNEEDTKMVVVDKDKADNKVASSKPKLPCNICVELFDSFDSLVCHNRNVHNVLTCKTCYEIFLDDAALQEHKEAKHKFQCSKCNICKSTLAKLQKHEDRAHNTFVCKVCGKYYQGLDKLHAHEQKHDSHFECPKCQKRYTTRDFYEKHVELCTTDSLDPHPVRSAMEKKCICPECGKGYSTAGGLRVHIRFEHNNEKPHVCKQCGKKFIAPSCLKVHMLKHTGEKNFKCNICNNRLVSKEALLYHTRRHTGERPYSCKICDEKFVNASARAEHVKYKHRGPTYTCDVCQHKFFTASFLKQHKGRHNDPSSKLFVGRLPPNMPGEQNMRIKTEWSM